MAELNAFSPVEKNVARPSGLRQSLLATFDNCPRSGYLTLKHQDGISSHAAQRGTAFHLMAEIALKTMIENGEDQYPPEMARSLMDEILSGKVYPEDEGPLIVPRAEHDSLRAMAWNWAKATYLYPGIVGVERQAYMEIEGWQVHGTIDVAMVMGPNAMLHDYKTRFTIPSQESYVKQFQAPFYALLMWRGKWADTHEKIAEQPLDGVLTVQRYPRHYDEDEGRLAERSCEWTADDMMDIEVAVRGILARIDHGLETGEYPAIPGYHCGFCPAQHECPIPKEFRPLEQIDSLEDAEKMAALWSRHDSENRRLKASIRNFADANDYEGVAIGNDSELGFIRVQHKNGTTSTKWDVRRQDA